MANLEVVQNHEVARPLKILVPLIEQDIQRGDEAGMEFYMAAGAKLIEAEEGHFENNSRGFYQWAEKVFKRGRTALDRWMSSAAVKTDKPLRSLRKIDVEIRGHKPTPTGPGTRIYREWTAPVDAIADKARDEQRRLIASEHVSRQQEREAKFKLKLRIIDIGYKVLARELHPDKVGGSREAMTRLNEARNELKANA